jgi:hypothetical protein
VRDVTSNGAPYFELNILGTLLNYVGFNQHNAQVMVNINIPRLDEEA